MNTTSADPGINYGQHQLEMLLWQAQIHEKSGKKQEASKIRAWVADFLGEQSEFNEEPEGVIVSDSEENQEQC